MDIQWNSDFSNLQWKQKLERKIGLLEKSEVKVECSVEEWETTFGFSYREVSENGGSRNCDFINEIAINKTLCSRNKSISCVLLPTS